MTVCVAALCRWDYSKDLKVPDVRTIAICASDRMITFGDVQYEPRQTKVAQITQRTILLIAGDYSLHSEAIKSTNRTLAGRQLPPHDVALIYGRAIQEIKRRQAENIFLAPIGLNTDLLNAQNAEMSEYMASTLLSQMQNFRGEEVEALVVGIEGENAAIYHVDTAGTVACADDVGFAAIGSGAWHARSRLMQSGYTNSLPYFAALAAVYAAKKSADISPGVGSQTDIHIAFRDQTERLVPETNAKLAELHDKFRAESDELAQKAVDCLCNFVFEQKKAENEQKTIGSSGGDTQDNESVVEDASEAAQEVERNKKSEKPVA